MADSTASLHEAALAGDIKQLTALLDAGADLDAVNSSGATPLHFAAGKAQLSAVKLLVERGAKVDIKTASGNTALHNAASSKGAKAVAVIEVLLAAGADVNAVGTHGNTPWFLSRTAQIAQALANAGANLAHENTNGHTAAQFASIVGDHGREKFLEATKPSTKGPANASKAASVTRTPGPKRRA